MICLQYDAVKYDLPWVRLGKYEVRFILLRVRYYEYEVRLEYDKYRVRLLGVREFGSTRIILCWKYENYPLVYFGIRFAHILALCLRIGRVKLSIRQELVYNFVKYVWKE